MLMIGMALTINISFFHDTQSADVKMRYIFISSLLLALIKGLSLMAFELVLGCPNIPLGLETNRGLLLLLFSSMLYELMV